MITPTAYRHDLQRPRSEILDSLRGSKAAPFWLDSPDRPAPRAVLSGDTETDLLVVGGGYCGLWTAVIAKERDPNRRVILLEGNRIGWAASGRNGGFVESSLTHGPENGALHFKTDLSSIHRFEEENFTAFADALRRYKIDAEWEETGMLTVATEPHEIAWLKESAADGEGQFLERDELSEYAASPLYRAGLFAGAGVGYVHPAKLAWGLARAAEELGVEIFEQAQATKLKARKNSVAVYTEHGTVRARHVALATSVFRSLLPSLRLFTVPIYDYALMTEPLTTEQLAQIGWTGRHGITDSSREFHYYRKTADNRILLGGYDAIYHRGRRVKAVHDQRPETFERLADHFTLTFPALKGVRFTHRWGGAIDMSTQVVAFHGAAKRRRVAYSAGYTGLGVGATRFGAEVMLGFLEGKDTERTRLKMSRRLPIPIPPEPIAYPLISLMRRAVAKSDRNGGKDGLLLKLAGSFGVGFDS